MKDQLEIFGWVAVIVFGLTIAVPYLLRRSDLLTVWNLFLLGSMNFVGYAAIQSANGVYSYGIFTGADYARYIVGAVVVYTALYLAYYRVPLPAKLAGSGKMMRHWPAYHGFTLGFIIGVCCLMLMLSVYFPNIQFIGQILIIIGPSAGVIAVALAFCRWWQTKTSIWLLALVGALLLLSTFAAIHGQSGRRALLSVLVVMPFVLYWIHLRYRAMVYTMVPLLIGAFVGVIILAGYSTIRGRHNAEIVNVTGRSSSQTAIESLRMLPMAIIEMRGMTEFLGGDAVDASLVAIDRYTKVAAPEPFFTLKYVLLHPMPRAFWPEKPEALGQTLPRDTGVWERTGFVNWGPGIVGHGFHEGGARVGGIGGFVMLAFYGVLFGVAMRYFDELLVRQPDNPYILGIFAAASGQIIAFSRGDVALFCVLIIGAVLAGLTIKFIGRIFFGYSLIYPSDRERAAEQQVQPAQVDEWGYPQAPMAAQYAQN